MYTLQTETVASILGNTDSFLVPQMSSFSYKEQAVELVKKLDTKGNVLLGTVVVSKVFGNNLDVARGFEKLLICYHVLKVISELYKDVEGEEESIRAKELEKQYLAHKYDGELIEKFRFEVFNDESSEIHGLYLDLIEGYVRHYFEDVSLAGLDDEQVVKKLKELEEALLMSKLIWIKADNVLEANQIDDDLTIFEK